MKTVVRGQLRMKRGRQHAPLLRSDDAPVVQAGQNLGITIHRFDERGADEHRVVWPPIRVYLPERGDIQVHFEARHLASKGVALHPNIHYTQ